MTEAEQIISVVADSPDRVRSCDCERLFDMALEANAIKQVKSILGKCNPGAMRTFEECESEHFTEIYQPELSNTDR